MNEKCKNFYRRLRHWERANWLVLMYSFKSLMCWASGDHKDTDFVRVAELASSKTVKDLPLSIWSYEYCIAYAKLIRKRLCLFSADSTNNFNFDSLQLFGNHHKEDSSLVNYFTLVAERCGFKVSSCNNDTIYTLTSTYEV